jgi:ATP-dependent exoDNAse (exonuclease V) beta subunit
MKSEMGTRNPEMKLPPDNPARITALTGHDRTLLVEAGAGSGKTALMAGRVAMLIADNVHPKGIVAITFTEAAASELLERVERFVQELLMDSIPIELVSALPEGLSSIQRENIRLQAQNLDEITCTTIHGFCKQLIKPYSVETKQDPGAAIADPAASDLAYRDLTRVWLSEKFGRQRGTLKIIDELPQGDSGTDGNFLMELIRMAPDKTISLIEQVGKFLNGHRTAGPPKPNIKKETLAQFRKAVDAIHTWYGECGVAEPDTSELLVDLERVAALTDKLREGWTGPQIVELLFHECPTACKKGEFTFKLWRRKGKWQDAAVASGKKKKDGDPLSQVGEGFYQACGEAYEAFCGCLGEIAFQYFVREFDTLKKLYGNHKRTTALLDFDDLLHNARDLLKNEEMVRLHLSQRYPRILVDEFQDTDPLQAEILWLLTGESDMPAPWFKRVIRPGALFLVGDPKQAIYRFRGADVGTYLTAKQALLDNDPEAVIKIMANFRAQAPILQFVNTYFKPLLNESLGQPGFTDLLPIRQRTGEPSVQAFEITLDSSHRTESGGLSVDLIRKQEAKLLADILQSLIGSYPVWDKKLESFRTANAGDIALLAPSGTNLWIYERALEDRKIPIATQAGKGFFSRQEVQDLIAVARTIADPSDTLAFGALIRGPLVGLTEEEIADEIHQLQEEGEVSHPLKLWTDPSRIKHPLLKDSLATLQKIAGRVRQTTPYLLMAEAVELFHIRPKLKARHPQGAERALANVELVLEMARSYSIRGMGDFARVLTESWQNADRQVEGRPDEDAHSVKIITMHSSKGLEWPIVIPINSMTTPNTDKEFIYRGSDDTIHFKVCGYPNLDYEEAVQQESQEIGRERVRLWYVALTRARDLLLLPRQSERISGDWFSLIDIDLTQLPLLDHSRFTGSPNAIFSSQPNIQDPTTWEIEQAKIASNQLQIEWHQPSRHEGAMDSEEVGPEIFTGSKAVDGKFPRSSEKNQPQGGPERGTILHKLMEEILTGETEDNSTAIQVRGAELLGQLGYQDQDEPSKGLSSREMAATIKRTLNILEIKELRPRLLPEFWVYSNYLEKRELSLTAGVADAVSIDDSGRIDTVIDWKSDIDPTPAQIRIYFRQMYDYLKATSALTGLIVFMSSGHIERIKIPAGSKTAQPSGSIN